MSGDVRSQHCGERILEAIDQLRRRKARPDAQRICNYMQRRFAVGALDTRAELQRCVERDIVLKVEYKGQISYRNAAKKYAYNLGRKRELLQQRVREGSTGATAMDYQQQALEGGGASADCNPQSRPPQLDSPTATTMTTATAAAASHATSKPNRKFAALLSNVITEIVVQEPDYLELGVPEAELINTIVSKDNVRYSKKYVGILIEKEVEHGGLIRMENGHLSLGSTSHDLHKSYDSDNDRFGYKFKGGKRRGGRAKKVDDDADYDFRLGNSQRVGGRRKRAKKVFDPSDNNLPRKRGRPSLPTRNGNISGANLTTVNGSSTGSASQPLEKAAAPPKLSDNDSTSRPDSRSSSYSRDQGGVCSVCHTQNRKNDKIVSCRECSNKAHLSCLNAEDNMMLRMNPDNTWQCPHCKMCVVCYETSNSGYLAVCAICADAYHAKCHEPRISEKIRNGMKWICMNCQMPEQLAVNEIQPNVSHSNVKINRENEETSPSVSGHTTPVNFNPSPPPSPTPPALSPQMMIGGGEIKRESVSPETRVTDPDSQSVKDLDLEEIDPSIPDASNWSYDDVYNYFAQYFPEEAKVFKEQEIDGHSLLLMKRVDVLTSLKLKLGPALKIYRHVVKLQIRRDDPKLYWL